MKWPIAARGRPGKPVMPPPRTTAECAEMLGLQTTALANYLKADPAAPQPRLRTRGVAGRKTWYDPAEVRRWWKAHNEAKAKEVA